MIGSDSITVFRAARVLLVHYSLNGYFMHPHVYVDKAHVLCPFNLLDQAFTTHLISVVSEKLPEKKRKELPNQQD